MADRPQIDLKRLHDLTVDEIRACAAFSHFTDEQTNEAIETLKSFTKIAYDFYEKDAKKGEK